MISTCWHPVIGDISFTYEGWESMLLKQTKFHLTEVNHGIEFKINNTLVMSIKQDCSCASLHKTTTIKEEEIKVTE